MKVTDWEQVIDMQFNYEDIKEITEKGIIFPDYDLLFEEAVKNSYYEGITPGIFDRKYVCDRNSMTKPLYMKFVVNGKVVIILFKDYHDYGKMIGELKVFGYETYDIT